MTHTFPTFFWLILLMMGAFTACQPTPSTVSDSKDTKTAEPAVDRFGFASTGLRMEEAMVKPNENLSEILSRYQVPMAKIAELAALPRDLFDVRRIQANRPYTVFCTPDSLPQARCFVYHPNNIDYVAVAFDDSLRVWRGTRKVDTLTHSLTGVIETSLYQSILDGGGSPVLVNKLADIYAWEIDFFGLQTGDRYRIFFTTYEVEGEPAGVGDILSASFTHMGEERLAFRYDQGDGEEYYDEQGESLRKTFLKAPLSYTRISSRFSYSRLHPILKIRRPHLGVDYAAPRGTPVVAVGDGVVTKAGWGGGGGRTVKIKHNSNYETAYLHLYRYGDGITPGATVKQGQIIGYVGSTGLSTGPHLDFRFYKNGQPVDPLQVDPPSADPITDAHCAAFMAERDRYWRILEDIRFLDQEQWLAER